MKKLFLALFLLLITISCFAQETEKEYIIKNDKISITMIKNSDKNIYFSNITDLATNTNFMSDKIEKITNLWTLSVKKSREYNSDEIFLTPANAENINIRNNGKTINITWYNVKNENMKDGFDVTVTGEIKKADSYWNIKVKSHTKDYGIWIVKFPDISGINFVNSNELFTPIYGGWLENENENGGVGALPENKTSERNKFGELGFPSSACPFQVSSLTKNGSSLYFTPEDKTGFHKKFYFDSVNNKEINYYVMVFPNDQGVGGVDYNQAYKFNIAVFEGDWFDAAKKYRQWGIDNKYTPYAKGRIADRKDFPNWMKNNVFWGNTDQQYDAGGVPTAFHLYAWWHLPHDNGYPEMLPANSDIKERWIDPFNKAGIRYMFYTNPHLIDTKNSETYKKYGDSICNLGPDLKPKEFDWGGGTTINHAGCPNVKEFTDAIIKLQNTLEKDYHVDGIYLDEISIINPEPCFNEKHGHPVGTGNRWAKAYTKLMNDIKKQTSKIKGEPTIITSEGICAEYPTDANLHLLATPFMPHFTTVLYSGYRDVFGMFYFANEVEGDQQPAINKLGFTLVGGWQLGWYFYFPKSIREYPNFAKYLRGAAAARYAAVKYFNMGEMVREVKIKNDIPKVKTIYNSGMGFDHKLTVPIIKTASFNFEGSTMVVFTNISINNSQMVDWESTAKALYLKDKPSYEIEEIYPNKVSISKESKIIGGQTTLAPLETKIIIIK